MMPQKLFAFSNSSHLGEQVMGKRLHFGAQTQNKVLGCSIGEAFSHSAIDGVAGRSPASQQNIRHYELTKVKYGG